MSSTNIKLSELAKNLTDNGQIDKTSIAGLSSVIDSSGVLGLIDSDYVQLRQSASAGDQYVQLNQAGTLQLTTGTARWTAPKNINITNIVSIVGTAPTGSALITTVNKNGTTIDTQTIAAGTTSDTNSGLSLSVNQNDYLTVDVTQIGSTVAGSDLSIVITYVDG